MTYLMLFNGLALLLISGGLPVRLPVALASHFKLSKPLIALAVVSSGSPAPGLVPGNDAALSGHAYPGFPTGLLRICGISLLLFILILPLHGTVVRVRKDLRAAV